jgi:hypothetical protein
VSSDRAPVELGRQNSNVAGAVAATKELLSRAPAPELDVGTDTMRGVSLSDLLDRFERDVRAEAVSILVDAIGEGYDLDALVTAARDSTTQGK